MKCPHCGAAKLVHDTRDMPYTYKGETTTIPAVSGDFCPSCDEVVLNAAESARQLDGPEHFARRRAMIAATARESADLALERYIGSNDLHATLLIKDNGQGFDVNEPKSGIGLQNIRRRVQVLGGQIHINSTPGNGCEILVEIPVA